MRGTLPTGTVTFVLTDIAGSTRTLDELGEEGYAFELENLRSALSWCLDHGDHGAAQSIAGSLGVYWVDRGLLNEMRWWLERSLEAGGEGGTAHTLASMRLSQVRYLQGDYERARSIAEASLAQARTLGDPVDIVRAMFFLAQALEAEGSWAEGWAIEVEALEIPRELRSTRPRLLLVALNNLGYEACALIGREYLR